jgi:hypothetical protein
MIMLASCWLAKGPRTSTGGLMAPLAGEIKESEGRLVMRTSDGRKGVGMRRDGAGGWRGYNKATRSEHKSE